MKCKKILSTIAAIAIAATSFAGLGITANAATGSATVTMTYVDGSNGDTAYGVVEQSRLGYNKISGGSVGLGNSSWGVNQITYLKVDASSIKGTITKVTLTADVSGSTNSKYTTVAGVGYNSSTWSADMTYNKADRSITTLDTTKTTTSKSSTKFDSLSWDITNALKTDDDKIATILMYATNPAGGYVKNPTVSVDYVEAGATLYTATFTETNSLKPTVTIYSDEAMSSTVDNGNLLDATTYYYKAVLEGYFDKTGSFTVNGENPTVSFTMVAKTPAGAVTLNYVDGDSNNIGSKSVDMSGKYVDDSLTYYYPAYVTYENKLYKSSTNTYSGSIAALTAEAISRDVTYTKQDTEVFQYKEFDGANPASNIESFSNGQGGEGGSDEELSAFTVAKDGLYKVTVHAGCKQSDNNRLGALNVNGTQVANVTYSNGAGTINVIENVALKAGDTVGVKIPRGAYQILDYVLIERTGDLPPVISAATMTAPVGITAPTTTTATEVDREAGKLASEASTVDLTGVKTVYIKVDNAVANVMPTVKVKDVTYTPTYKYTAGSCGYFVYQFVGIDLTGATVTYTGAADTEVNQAGDGGSGD